jgi:hypothetical protein
LALALALELLMVPRGLLELGNTQLWFLSWMPAGISLTVTESMYPSIASAVPETVIVLVLTVSPSDGLPIDITGSSADAIIMLPITTASPITKTIHRKALTITITPPPIL